MSRFRRVAAHSSWSQPNNTALAGKLKVDLAALGLMPANNGESIMISIIESDTILNRITGMNRVWRIVSAALGLIGLNGLADIQADPVPGRGLTNLTVRAAAGDRILRLGGHYLTKSEGSLEPGLGLTLNGTPLDGSRLRGPAFITTPLLEKAYGSVFLRYHAATRTFVFKRDADEIPNNGPWTPYYRPVRYKTNHSLPWIQLDVGDLLKAGDNSLVVTNVYESRFALTALSTTATVEEAPDPLLPMPSWIVFSQSAAERTAYEKALEAGLFKGEEKAELLAALGVHEAVDRHDMAAAATHWKAALAAAPAFPSRPEILYRTVAERVTSGAWLLPEADVRAGLKDPSGPDGWTELAQTVLATADGRPAAGPRLVVTAALAAGPLKIDGVPDEPVWETARAYPLQYVLGTNAVQAGWGEVRFAFSADQLAVAFSGRLPTSVVWTAGTNRDASVWKDNAVELLLSPDPQFRTYYELNASPNGGVFDGRHGWYWKGDPDWNGEWTTVGRIEGDRFTLEYGIPWKTIGLDGPPPPNRRLTATVIRVLVDKNEKGEPVVTYLSVTPHRFFDTHRLMDGLLLQFPAVNTQEKAP